MTETSIDYGAQIKYSTDELAARVKEATHQHTDVAGEELATLRQLGLDVRQNGEVIKRVQVRIYLGRLVSMDGLKPLTVEKMIQNTGQLYGMYPMDVQIGVDNDRAGQAFFDRLSKKIMATPDGERITFHSLIPFDKHLPKTNLLVYQETAKRHGIDWRWIAAIHKAETNLSRTNELVNGFNYEAFFGRDLPKNHQPESIDLEKACERCAQHLERYTSEGRTNITDALINTKLPFEDKRGFENKVKSVYNWYLGGDFQTDDYPFGLPGKDWNDALLLNGNAREQDYPYKHESPVTARKTVSRMRA